MASSAPLYIGFDLSTQQLKALVVNAELKVVHEVTFDFDNDSHGFKIKNGVITNEAEHEIFAPVSMWLQALDNVLHKLKEQGLDFRRVRGVSGAGQQHGSVYWSINAEDLLGKLDKEMTLEEQLHEAFSHPFSPNWQDASTQAECDEFDAFLGGPDVLAEVTGSKAHHVRSLGACQDGTWRYSLLTTSMSFLEVYRTPNTPVSEEIPGGVQEDVKDFAGIVFSSISSFRPNSPTRHLRCLRYESLEYKEGGI
jgi:hypothetical protein